LIVTSDLLSRAARIMARCDQLAQFSEEPGQITRRYGTAALRETQEVVAGWMRDAGLAVRRDAVGNLIGRREGPANSGTLLLGSHLDSVRDAGRYDGVLGVLLALEAVACLHDEGIALPFAVDIVAFADEEGLRFHSTYLGSRAITGALDEATLALTDAAGVSVRQAMRDFGCDPDALASACLPDGALLGYVEAHIEQGPVLESLDLPVGIVTAISSQLRAVVTFTGVAGHAGTVPMALRHDALCAAAEFILTTEAIAHDEPGLVATIGQITALPGASNVVPGSAVLSLDVRHADDVVRENASAAIHAQATEIAHRRGVELDWRVMQSTAAIRCDESLSHRLAAAVADAGYDVHHLPSGAGHDAVPLSAVAPVAMLFVRCAGGVSHNPAESVTVDDVAAALEVLDRFLRGERIERDHSEWAVS
jgi:allantoate deiminase